MESPADDNTGRRLGVSACHGVPADRTMSDQDNTEFTNGETGDGGINATPTKPRKRQAPKQPSPRQLPPWKVILHNDDVSVMDDVVKAIRQVTQLNKEEAIARTLEAHTSGAALLLVTAILYLKAMGRGADSDDTND